MEFWEPLFYRCFVDRNLLPVESQEWNVGKWKYQKYERFAIGCIAHLSLRIRYQRSRKRLDVKNVPEHFKLLSGYLGFYKLRLNMFNTKTSRRRVTFAPWYLWNCQKRPHRSQILLTFRLKENTCVEFVLVAFCCQIFLKSQNTFFSFCSHSLKLCLHARLK